MGLIGITDPLVKSGTAELSNVLSVYSWFGEFTFYLGLLVVMYRSGKALRVNSMLAWIFVSAELGLVTRLLNITEKYIPQ
ncbi:hypothetical protein ACR52_26010 [Pseudomonas fildesensis]|uniref:Uncharacterized protein n=1 Tax=Pseudomonas fildesensis TaxID=1674920 RepID=A0A0J8FV37_9PSED|nr:hypothetical protein ACR52_26010 [Pseudomonas fildesensis]